MNFYQDSTYLGGTTGIYHRPWVQPWVAPWACPYPCEKTCPHCGGTGKVPVHPPRPPRPEPVYPMCDKPVYDPTRGQRY